MVCGFPPLKLYLSVLCNIFHDRDLLDFVFLCESESASLFCFRAEIARCEATLHEVSCMTCCSKEFEDPLERQACDQSCRILP